MSKQKENLEALHIHIEGLQAVLKRRNDNIARLENVIEEMKQDHTTQHDVKNAYRKGWQDCAEKLMSTVHQAALDLRQVKSDAFRIYLDGDTVEDGGER